MQPSCTEKEFEELVNIFSDSVYGYLREHRDVSFDPESLIASFGDQLKGAVNIVPSFVEDQKAQYIKGEIERMQQRAIKWKSRITASRNSYIESVRVKCEQELESQRPDVEEIPEISSSGIPSDAQSKLALLDMALEQLQSEIHDTKTIVESDLVKLGAFLTL